MSVEYFDPIDLCVRCQRHYFEAPFLVEACASVGIEHGKSTGLLLKEYFDYYHASKHRLSPTTQPPSSETVTDP